MYVAKRKALISLAITAQLICVFIFAYGKNRFSNDTAQIDQEMLYRYRRIRIELLGYFPRCNLLLTNC